jgi:hypothetical protein
MAKEARLSTSPRTVSSEGVGGMSSGVDERNGLTLVDKVENGCSVA